MGMVDVESSSAWCLFKFDNSQCHLSQILGANDIPIEAVEEKVPKFLTYYNI